MTHQVRWHLLGKILAIVVVASLSLRADETDERYFAALRERQLWSIAETACLRELNALPQDSLKRIPFLLELSATFSSHARHIPDAVARREMWAEARERLQTELTQATLPEARALLAAQQAFVACDEREVATLYWQLLPLDESWRAEVSRLQTRAIHELERLETSLLQFKPTPRLPADAESWRFDARALQKLVQQRLAAEYLASAAGLAGNSPDRADLFLKAEQRLKRLLAGATDEPVTQTSYLLMAELQRRRGEFDKAQALLTQLERLPISDAQREDIACDRALVSLANRQPLEAAESLRRHTRLATQFRRSTMLLVESLLALSATAADKGDRTLSEELLQEADRVAQASWKQNGYWKARCQQLVESARAERRFGTETARLLAEARGRYASGSMPTAIDLMGRAYRSLPTSAAEDARFELALTLARLLTEHGQPNVASDFSAEALRTFPQQARRNELHFLWAVSLGRAFQADPTEDRRSAFTSGLRQHLEEFPQSGTCGDGAWLLGQIEERLQHFDAALSAYQRVPPEHVRRDASRAATARCWGRWCQLATAPAEITDRRSAALKWFETELAPALQRLAKNDVHAEAELSPTDWEILPIALRLLVTGGTADEQRAREIFTALRQPLSGTSGGATMASRLPIGLETALRLKFGSPVEVLGEARQAALNESDQLVLRTRALLAEADQLKAADRELIANHVRLVIKLIRDHHIVLSDQLRSDMKQLNDAADDLPSGRATPPATPTTSNPQPKPEPKPQQPNTTSDSSPAARIAALKQREKQESPGSANWMAVRCELIELLIERRELADARKLARVTRLLYPRLGDEKTRARFEQLEQQLAQ